MVRISVIIPTIGRYQDLRRCLAALEEAATLALATRDAEIEVVVVADGCQLEPEWIPTWLPLRVMRTGRRIGAQAARQLASQSSDADVLAFLDDDALPRGDWFRVIIDSLSESTVAITGRVLPMTSGLLSRARQARYDQRYNGLHSGDPVSFFAGGNSAVLTNVFRATGGFRHMGTGGDNSLCESLHNIGMCVTFIPELVIVHHHDKGLRMAVAAAAGAGLSHQHRLTPRSAWRSLMATVPGDSTSVRLINQGLNLVYTVASAMPGDRRQELTQETVVNRSPDSLEALSEKHATGTLSIGIIGLGYVGLAQAVAFTEAGFDVIGYDTDCKTRETIRSGNSPVETVQPRQLRRSAGKLTVVDLIDELRSTSVLIICVPTPLDAEGHPDLGNFQKCISSVSSVLKIGHLVCIESTVYPGATREIALPLLQETGLRVGRDFNLAYAPERINPGGEVKGIPRVIGGATQTCARRAAELYSRLPSKVDIVPTIEVAEAAKMLENGYRLVNISLVNEFATYCSVKGIDAMAAITAAAKKPFGFTAFSPSAGAGGDCVPVDPVYLLYDAARAGLELSTLRAAVETNLAMPGRVAGFCCETMRQDDEDPAKCRVLVLGLAYKPGVSDTRNSASKPLISELQKHFAEVVVHDPRVPAVEICGRRYLSVSNLRAAIRDSDLVVVVQRHAEYSPALLAEARRLYHCDESAAYRRSGELLILPRTARGWNNDTGRR